MMLRLIRNLKPNDRVYWEEKEAIVWEIELARNQIGLKFVERTEDKRMVGGYITNEFFVRFTFFDTDYIQFKNQNQ